MQPKTAVKFDKETFERLKESVNDIAVISKERKTNPRIAAPIPKEIGIQLLYGCNLRCKVCYQWNDDGFFHLLGKEQTKKEISPETIEQILKDTHEQKSRLFLWGGEPLIHTQWDKIAKLLEKDRRWTTICTNGLLIEKKIDTLLPISENLVMLISLDGLHEANDNVRGKNTFKRIIDQINLLLELRKKGEYKGLITINSVLNDYFINHLYEFMEYFENLQVDSVYFNFPWYISESQANKMDDYYTENFTWQDNQCEHTKDASWHSYTYHISKESLPKLWEQIDKLNSREWKIRIRFQPALEKDEIESFITGTEPPDIKKRECFAVSNRVDIQADGKVGSCKFFPELHIGDINQNGIIDIWQSEKFGDFREQISKGLMPVCSKCILLYLNGK